MKPIVSYRKWHGRVLAQRVARALNVMISCVVNGFHDAKSKGRGKSKKINSGKVMELVNVNEAVNFVTCINKFKNWEGLLKDNKFTSVELDIKEQFTNLDRDECLKALDWICEEKMNMVANPVFLIMKRKSDKVADRMVDLKKVTGTNRRNAHVLSLKCIKEYVKFEMKHTYVALGEYIARQKKGLPIGGIVSAPMASIFFFFF